MHEPHSRASNRTGRIDALLLDIGDVITAPVWDQFDELEAVTGRTLVGRGPLDPEDDLWLQHKRAARSRSSSTGSSTPSRNGFADWRDCSGELGDSASPPLRRSERLRVDGRRPRRPATRSACSPTTASSIYGTDFFAGIPEFQALDAFVDARPSGSAKPDPEPYLRAAKAARRHARSGWCSSTTPRRASTVPSGSGMTGVLVDPIDKRPAFARTRSLLGI